MRIQPGHPTTLAEVLTLIVGAPLAPARRRDLLSAINRVCGMASASPTSVKTDADGLRCLLAQVRSGAHGLRPKTWSNLRSAFGAAVALLGVIDVMPRVSAKSDPAWGPLVDQIADKRISHGLAAFMNWCASKQIGPFEVDDEVVERFSLWLRTRSLHLKPHDVIRRVPLLWNVACEREPNWPQTKLSRRSFRKPRQHFQWQELAPSFSVEADAYLAARRKPDVFAPEGLAPRRPLAESTLRQQREHLRIAASLVARQRGGVIQVHGLGDLTAIASFKAVLRHFYERAEGEPNAFAIGIAKTLIDVARFQVRASSEDVAELKRLAGKLPAVPLDLTARNKSLLSELGSEGTRARLYRLPDELLAEVSRKLDGSRLPIAIAQVAIAADILLVAPVRAKPQPAELAATFFGAHRSQWSALAAHSGGRDKDQKARSHI